MNEPASPPVAPERLRARGKRLLLEIVLMPLLLGIPFLNLMVPFLSFWVAWRGHKVNQRLRADKLPVSAAAEAATVLGLLVTIVGALYLVLIVGAKLEGD